MNAKISVVCYKQKTLADGTSPLMLRISKDGKRTMRSLGLSMKPEHWDYKKESPEPKAQMPQQGAHFRGNLKSQERMEPKTI